MLCMFGPEVNFSYYSVIPFTAHTCPLIISCCHFLGPSFELPASTPSFSTATHRHRWPTSSCCPFKCVSVFIFFFFFLHAAVNACPSASTTLPSLHRVISRRRHQCSHWGIILLLPALRAAIRYSLFSKDCAPFLFIFLKVSEPF